MPRAYLAGHTRPTIEKTVNQITSEQIKMLVYGVRRKPEYYEKTLSKLSAEATTQPPYDALCRDCAVARALQCGPDRIPDCMTYVG